ncbi:MAG: hypothetical protein KC502_19265 [Myxococcales bacterium]|nr:hypothetical protein [Myxococcales bacterium]
MHKLGRIFLHTTIFVMAAGCVAVSDDEKTSDQFGTITDSADDQSAVPDATEVDDGGDVAPVGCDPTCNPWQVCADGVCGTKDCVDHPGCNAVGGPTAAYPEHWCVKGKCAAWQCADDSDCAGDDKCNLNTYRCYTPQTGCAYDAQCIDDKVCTDDTCDKATGACKHKVVKGCCADDKSCDDGVKCTVDKCTKGTCSHQSAKGCCQSDAECADSSACTTDTCKAGSCFFAKKPGCCTGSGSCDDGLDATVDACKSNLCVHTLASGPGSCKTNADCQGNACAKGACVAGQCSWTQTSGGSTCCVSDGQCASDTACVVDACLLLQCKATPVAGTGTHAWHHFDDASLTGWTVSKGNGAAWFHGSDLLTYAGKRALRYGVPGSKTWSGGFPNKGTATSAAFKVPKSDASLQFQVFFDGEPGAGVHQFGVRVADAKGQTTEVWTKNLNLKGNTAGKWVQGVAKLGSWAGQTIKIQVWFDVAVNFPKETGFGFVLDEMRLFGGCPQ